MKTLKKAIALITAALMAAAFAACGTTQTETTASSDAGTADGTAKTYKIGICNYVDDASLNQIANNIKSQLEKLGAENNVTFNVEYDNCNADENVLSQIITNFEAEKVDLMVGIATPVAMAMQSATAESGTPVVFSAVSDPLSAELVASLEKPGANITGTSDFLNTNAIFDIMFAQNPDIKTVGLLYDIGQDSSATPVAAAKAYLDKKGVAYKEYTGTTVDEVRLAAQKAVLDKVDAVFTPTDNTIMKSELSIYETFAQAKIPHYTGADSFALNGAFMGYGVDYANLGVETANMISDILVNGKNPAEVPVLTFDNGTATVNTDICKELGLDYETVAKTFAPFCTKVQPIQTAEEFE